jgi:hypothetical protein
MNQTIKLLKVIGSPFVSETETEPPVDYSEALRLYYCAVRNRMALLYLTALEKWRKLGELEKTYRALFEKSLKIDDAFLRVSGLLGSANVPHALFKTIRPYRSTTVDIDVIVFGSEKEYGKSLETMIRAGYKKLGEGPNSTTVRDPYIGIGVDLYKEVAASQIIYLDKEKIYPYVSKKDMHREKGCIRTLHPSADLIALIAHSVIKEHMYTLSEYYSTIYFLAKMSVNDIEGFISMIYANNIVNAAQVHLGMTAKLHGMAHGKIPEKVRMVVDMIKTDSIEMRKLDENYETPYKFQILTVIKALLEKIRKDEKTRRSIAKQAASTLNPSFAADVLKNIVDHVLRETY